MTEITENTITSKPLPQPLEAFILQWGEQGNSWGVNRSISQIHAFVYLAEQPLTADEIAQQLGMARSNVSNSLKELLLWKLIYRVPVRGDRREHFAAETDVWKIAMLIAAGRKAREIDPALEALQKCSEQADSDPDVSPEARKRLHAMLDFTRSVDHWYNQMLSMPQAKRDMILRLGAKIASFLPGMKKKSE